MFTKTLVLLVVGACFAHGLTLGGHSGINPNDKEVTDMLEKAITAENAKSNGEPKEVVKILSASKQVVAGNLYTITYLSKGQWFGKLTQCQIILHKQQWVSKRPKVIDNKCVPV